MIHDELVARASLPPADLHRLELHASFAERLVRRSIERRSTLCAGIDPTPEALALLTENALDTRIAHADAIERFSAFVIESVRDHAVAVKPQLAWFELAGWQGMRALERTIAYARTADLLVIVDAKRGDVPHTASGYARAWLGTQAESGMGGDALTVHAAVGEDTLQAMAEVARERHCELYALVHTSNSGAATTQSAPLADGTPWWRILAAQVDAAGCGAVVGATQRDVLAAARLAMPRAALLLPGVGAQGGSVDDLGAIASPTAPPPLVAASRSLLPPDSCSVGAFRAHVATAARELSRATSSLAATPVGKLAGS